MANNTATLVLDGTIPARQYNEAIEHFDGLLVALTDEISNGAGIDWLVDGLEYTQSEPYPSAITTVRGEAPNLEPIERVVRRYSVVGKALASHAQIPFGETVRKNAEGLTSVLNGKIVAIRFETREEEWTVSKRIQPGPPFRAVASYGAIEGQIETLSKRKGLRFTLYDALNDRAVSCYLENGNEDRLRDA